MPRAEEGARGRRGAADTEAESEGGDAEGGDEG